MSKLAKGTLLVSVIADSSTVTGLLLTGVGERNSKNQQNFMIVDKESDTAAVKAFLKGLLDRDDVGVVLISQNIAETVRDTIIDH